LLRAWTQLAAAQGTTQQGDLSNLNRIQDHIVAVSRESADEFFRYALAVAEDRLDWQPEQIGQSVLSMAREIAVTPEWAMSVLTDKASTDEERSANAALMKSWKSIEQCQAEFGPRFEVWAEYVAAIPDEELSGTKWLPYNGGRDHTILELLEYVRWNCAYHVGQVAYIQTLYGDKALY